MLLALGVACCAPDQGRFDAGQAAYALGAGRGVIAGRTSGPGHASCAGEYASRIPITEYTTARLARIYGSGDTAAYATAPRLPRDPGFDRFVVRASCDKAGRFTFTRVPDGDYYVVAPLLAPGEPASHKLSVRRRVHIADGAHRAVSLSL